MKPEYKIIAYYDRQCTNPVYIKKTFNRDFIKNEKFKNLPDFYKLDRKGMIGPIKFFIRKRPACTTLNEFENVRSARTIELQKEYSKAKDSDHPWTAKPFVRHIWEEVTLKEI